MELYIFSNINIYVTDRLMGLHIWCLTAWKHGVYIIQHVHMEDIDIWQKKQFYHFETLGRN